MDSTQICGHVSMNLVHRLGVGEVTEHVVATLSDLGLYFLEFDEARTF